TDLRQKRSHLDRVHLVTQTPVQFPMHGTDAAINVSEFALVTVEHHRAQRSRSPTTSDTGHAAKTGLVLKHQPNRTLAHGLRSQHGLQLLGQRFFSIRLAGLAGSWDVVCRGPLCASGGDPAADTPPSA